MAQKKSGSGPKHPAKRALPTKRPGARAAAAELTGAAPENDSKAQAEYFMQLIDNLAQAGDPESARIRSALIQVVADYGAARERGEDVAKLREATGQRVAALEGAVAEILLKSTRKLRDRVVMDSRRLGTSGKVGQSARTAAEGLELIVDALDKMLEASKAGDEAKKQEARGLLEKARGVMAPLQ